MTIELSIPMRTVSESNMRENWRARHGRRKKQRATVGMLVRNKMGLMGLQINRVKECAAIGVTLVRHSPGRLDMGNLGSSFKAVQDGVADALTIDDGDRRIAWMYEQVKDKEFSIDITIEIQWEGDGSEIA